MQMYAGVAHNKMLDEPGSNGECGAIVELVVLTNEGRYKYGPGGLTKDYELNATRFVATPAALRELADYLVDTAADAESMAKAVNKAMNESKAVRESHLTPELSRAVGVGLNDWLCGSTRKQR